MANPFLQGNTKLALNYNTVAKEFEARFKRNLLATHCSKALLTLL